MDVGHIRHKTFPVAKCQNARAFLLVLIGLGLLLVMSGFFVLNVASGQEMVPTREDIETISAAAFEEQTGLQVRQIRLSADSGLVDFRLKIVDGHKAQHFLSDPDKMPRLIVPDKGMTLFTHPQLDQSLSYRDGEEIVLLFGNTAGAVKPGTYVIVSFGELQIERLPVAAGQYHTGTMQSGWPGTARQMPVAQ